MTCVHADLLIEVQRGILIEEANRIAHEVEMRLHSVTLVGFA